MLLSQHKLCTRKKELATEVKFYHDFHGVTRPWRRTLTSGSDVKYVIRRCPPIRGLVSKARNVTSFYTRLEVGGQLRLGSLNSYPVLDKNRSSSMAFGTCTSISLACGYFGLGPSLVNSETPQESINLFAALHTVHWARYRGTNSSTDPLTNHPSIPPSPIHPSINLHTPIRSLTYRPLGKIPGHPLVHWSSNPSTHLSIPPSTFSQPYIPPIGQDTGAPTRPLILQPIHTPIHPSINLFAALHTVHWARYRGTHSSTDPPTHPHTYPSLHQPFRSLTYRPLGTIPGQLPSGAPPPSDSSLGRRWLHRRTGPPLPQEKDTPRRLTPETSKHSPW